MKKLFIITILCVSAVLYAQETIDFQNSTFKEILAKAKKEKKIIFIDAFAEWCGPCKMMEKNVFPLESVRNYYNANFINSRFDMEKGEGREIAMKYNIRSYPTYLFLNGDGEVVMKNYGYMGEQDFLTIAKEANNPKYANFSSKELFEKGEKDPELLLNMMRLYSDTDYELAKKVSERYFTVTKDQPLTKDNVGLLLYFIRSTDDANYKIFVNRKTEISAIISPDVYKQFDSNIKLSKYLQAALNLKTGKIDDEQYYKNAIPLVGKTEAETALNRMKIMFYPSVGNYAEYEKAALSFYKTPENAEPEELLKAAWIFSEHVDNSSSLKKAEEWAEKSVMKSETPENTYILAKLYAKSGKKENAKIYAEIAKNLALQNGKDATLAEQLLQSLK